ncbi:hypothetical protein PCANC_08584 [Puccinia coronata f. sp. avenae]|uniref:Uncharacterized protein n=1 Tax=Puccinia coronata f. sp. avenae TaxID=200324 RepID=A0A2N5V1X6_9BASI|nr:hypothetical protein PCANC_08584 [Puccinia coronata f. sp. avenae]
MDAARVAESVQELREYIQRHPAIIKPTTLPPRDVPASPTLDLTSTTLPAPPLSQGPNPAAHTTTTPPPSAPSVAPVGPPTTTTTTTVEAPESSETSPTTATLKRINRTIKLAKDRATNNMLTGVNIKETLSSARTRFQPCVQVGG